MILLVVVTCALPGAARASGVEDTFVSWINGERTTRGLAPLAADPSLAGVARRHSEEMAASGRAFHSTDLAGLVTGWVLLGENVGGGPLADRIHQAFMASPTHRAEILERRYRGVAIGVVEGADTRLWITEIFILREGSAGVAAQPPPPAAPVGPERRAPAEASALPAPAPPAPEPPAPPAPEPPPIAPASQGEEPRFLVRVQVAAPAAGSPVLSGPGAGIQPRIALSALAALLLASGGNVLAAAGRARRAARRAARPGPIGWHEPIIRAPAPPGWARPPHSVHGWGGEPQHGGEHAG